MPPMPRILAVLTILAILTAPAFAADTAKTDGPDRFADDRAFLLDGVESIGTSGSPGPVSVFGPDAFALIAGGSGNVQQTLVGAARMGRGRVVAFGHSGYLHPDTLAKKDTLRLFINTLRWAGDQLGRKLTARTLRVAVYRNTKLTELLKKNGINAATVNELTPPMQYHVLVADPTSIRSNQQLSSLYNYINSGGGYVASGLGWGWIQLNRGRDLVSDHVGNRLLRSAGLAWADGMISTTVDDGFSVTTEPSPYLNASAALDALLAHHGSKQKLSDADIAQALKATELAARSVPDDEPLLMLRLQQQMAELGPDAIPTAKNRISSKQPLERLAITLRTLKMLRAEPKDQKPDPAAANFPGMPPTGSPAMQRTITINPSVPNWHSTGTYAAPGQLVTVRVPPEIASLKNQIKVQIGAHKDRLWHLDAWQRCPEITLSRPIDSPQTEIANPFGGLVYIDVPKDCPASEFEVTIDGAVPAPYYVLGETDLDQWRDSIRKFPAPWAELQTDKVILTVPSETIRELDNPEEVMLFWDRVMDACAELSVRPLERERPERYVADRQISAGYMHAGYPIMTWLDVQAVFTDIEKLQRGNWGFFHEVGHNHQSGLWTFAGTGEVTVNLFTLYIYETVCGITIEQARSNMTRERRVQSFQKYQTAGTDFDQWKSDPFLALTMYVQLQQEFGWDTFKQVFTEYRDLPRDQQPRTDDEERDQWLVRFSKASGKNLGPFFELWGVPTSNSARQSIADLPTWIPDELKELNRQ